MPSYRTNDVTEKGEPIYRDVCNPITKEFYEELSKNILDAFNNRQTIGKNGLDIGEPSTEVAFTVKVAALLVTLPALLLTFTVYFPASLVLTLLIV